MRDTQKVERDSRCIWCCCRTLKRASSTRVLFGTDQSLAEKRDRFGVSAEFDQTLSGTNRAEVITFCFCGIRTRCRAAEISRCQKRPRAGKSRVVYRRSIQGCDCSVKIVLREGYLSEVEERQRIFWIQFDHLVKALLGISGLARLVLRDSTVVNHQRIGFTRIAVGLCNQKWQRFLVFFRKHVRLSQRALRVWIFLLRASLQLNRLFEVLSSFCVLLQVQLGKSGNLPGFGIIGMRLRKLLCLLRGGPELFLFEQKIRVLCIGRTDSVNDGFDRLHVQQRVVRAGSSCCRRGRGLGPEKRVRGGCRRGFLRCPARAPRPG